MLLCEARVVTPAGVLAPGWVEIAGARIAAVGAGAPPARPGVRRVVLHGRTLLPGFIDLHVHGGGGASYTVGDEASVRQALSFHRSAGTTRTLASLVTAPVDDLCAALTGLADCVEQGLIAGVHLEGPFLSRSHCGAQDPRSLLAPDREVVERLLAAGRGSVRMITLAPELPGGLDLVRQVVDAGVIAAIGHSNATYDTAVAAVEAGARVATHLFNGMRPIHQREPGIVGAALERPEVVCELIADGHHLHPAVLRLAFAAAAGRVALVTDAIAAAGAGDGQYPLGPLLVDVRQGRAYLHGGHTLAGSTTTTGASVNYALRVAELSLTAVAEAAAGRPARLLGIEDEVGTIEAGKLADLVVLDDSLRVEAVVLAGTWQGAEPAHAAPGAP